MDRDNKRKTVAALDSLLHDPNELATVCAFIQASERKSRDNQHKPSGRAYKESKANRDRHSQDPLVLSFRDALMGYRLNAPTEELASGCSDLDKLAPKTLKALRESFSLALNHHAYANVHFERRLQEMGLSVEQATPNQISPHLAAAMNLYSNQSRQ